MDMAIVSFFRRLRSRALAERDFGGGSRGGWYLSRKREVNPNHIKLVDNEMKRRLADVALPTKSGGSSFRQRKTFMYGVRRRLRLRKNVDNGEKPLQKHGK